MGGDKVRPQAAARVGERAANDLLYLAFMEINAGAEHDGE